MKSLLTLLLFLICAILYAQKPEIPLTDSLPPIKKNFAKWKNTPMSYLYEQSAFDSNLIPVSATLTLERSFHSFSGETYFGTPWHLAKKHLSILANPWLNKHNIKNSLRRTRTIRRSCYWSSPLGKHQLRNSSKRFKLNEECPETRLRMEPGITQMLTKIDAFCFYGYLEMALFCCNGCTWNRCTP